ncbi:uncharacterized protein STEHIDRAFT_116778 [Stereum hirsutum FP-91666 SS1]|uniref:J domain-containing protein n=1 Tax=Stereum hirsutum (strain FP-91666) TaxID=721885 RepID=R7RWF4_STEHR|nr:uncharacterized protein STEHIDRAFT_116778 [Stereum hirsutum FP-91666 SS1]EIM79120.1 hypothetical protein STEHIDRAFT_116778 [Stereum hirsutum FP-91666 SS1]
MAISAKIPEHAPPVPDPPRAPPPEPAAPPPASNPAPTSFTAHGPTPPLSSQPSTTTLRSLFGSRPANSTTPASQSSQPSSSSPSYSATPNLASPNIFMNMAQSRKEQIGEGQNLPAGMSKTFYPAQKAQQEAEVGARPKPRKANVKRKRDDDDPHDSTVAPATRKESKSAKTAKSTPSVPDTSFTVALLPNTVRANAGRYRVMSVSQLSQLDLVGLIGNVSLPTTATPFEIKVAISGLFLHVPAFVTVVNELLSPTAHQSPAPPFPQNPWNLLTGQNRGQGDRKGTVLIPFPSSMVIDFARLLRATGLTKPRNAATIWKNVIYICLPEGTANIPFTFDSSSDEDSSGAEEAESDDDVPQTNKKEEAPKVSPHTPASSSSSTAMPSTSTVPPSRTTSYSSSLPQKQKDDDNPYSTPSRVNGAGSFFTPFPGPYAEPDQWIGGTPRIMHDLMRAVTNVHQPAKPSSMWPLVPADLYMDGYKAKSSVQILYDLFCKNPEGITADIVWASVTDFFNNISFFNSMLDDPDASTMIKFGPKGLGFIIDGLCIAYRLLPSISFQFPRPSQDELIVLTGNLYKLIVKFKEDSDTPGPDMYSPDGFRDFISSVVRLDKSTSQCFAIATQNNWDHLCASSFVLKQDSPGALLQALDADFGSASDHSQMKSDNMRLGKWGLAKFIDALLIPFLDHYEMDDDSYYAIFSILQTFCREASKYIESCRKSKWKGKPTPARNDVPSTGDAEENQSEINSRRSTRASTATKASAETTGGTGEFADVQSNGGGDDGEPVQEEGTARGKSSRGRRGRRGRGGRGGRGKRRGSAGTNTDARSLSPAPSSKPNNSSDAYVPSSTSSGSDISDGEYAETIRQFLQEKYGTRTFCSGGSHRRQPTPRQSTPLEEPTSNRPPPSYSSTFPRTQPRPRPTPQARPRQSAWGSSSTPNEYIYVSSDDERTRPYPASTTNTSTTGTSGSVPTPSHSNPPLSTTAGASTTTTSTAQPSTSTFVLSASTMISYRRFIDATSERVSPSRRSSARRIPWHEFRSDLLRRVPHPDPARRIQLSTIVQASVTSQRRLLARVYHPDKNMQYGNEWASLCQSIMALINTVQN